MKKIISLTLLLLTVFLLSSCSADEYAEFVCPVSGEDKALVSLNLDKDCVSNSINLKSIVPAKVCYVEETDTVFFSSGDCIYQLTDGKTIPLVKMEGIALNAADGILFFINPTFSVMPESNITYENDESMDAVNDTGPMYSLDLSSMKLKKLADDVSNLSVYKDKIFFRRCKSETEWTEKYGEITTVTTLIYECDFDGGNERQIYKAFAPENGCSVWQQPENHIMTLYNVETDEETFLAEEYGDTVGSECIYKGYAYYLTETFSSNKTTVKKVSVADKTVEAYSPQGAYIVDYALYKGEICMLDLTDGLFITEGDNVMGCLHSYEGQTFSYTSLYTAGDDLFALKGRELYRLTIDEDRVVTEQKMGE